MNYQGASCLVNKRNNQIQSSGFKFYPKRIIFFLDRIKCLGITIAFQNVPFPYGFKSSCDLIHYLVICFFLLLLTCMRVVLICTILSLATSKTKIHKQQKKGCVARNCLFPTVPSCYNASRICMSSIYQLLTEQYATRWCQRILFNP